MDFTRLEINRRTALLTSAAIAANVINPMRAFAQETAAQGRRVQRPLRRRAAPAQPEHPGLDRRLHYRRQDPGESGSTSTPTASRSACSPKAGRRTPDGKTVTFKLRKGVTWHDGSPFTSADVAFTAHEHVEEDPQLRIDAAAVPHRGRHPRSADRDLPLRAADAAESPAPRPARPRLRLGQASL